MESFSYNTLTINGITKICDDNIYVIDTNKVINYQWHEHQLKYICDILKIQKKDKLTGLDLTPKQMGKSIENLFGDQEIIIASDNKMRDIEYGIISIKKKIHFQ